MKLFINQCRYQNLLALPGVGRKMADRQWEILTTKGFIFEEDLATIPYLRITRALIDSIDFTILSDETMNENFRCEKGEGSRVDQVHYERVKRLDNLWASKGRGLECNNKPYLRGMGPIEIRYKDETQWSRSPSPTTCRGGQDYDPDTNGEEFNICK